MIAPLLLALATTAPDVLVVVAFGDSTTVRREGVERVWPERVGAALTRRGHPAFVVNSGWPGDTTARARQRFERDVLLRAPDLVVLEFGLDDGIWESADSGPRVSLEDYEANLRAMLADLAQRSIPVVLVTPNPVHWTSETRATFGHAPYDVDDPRGLDRINAGYAARARALAAELEVPLADVHADFDSLGNEELTELVPDGIHPGEAGHERIASLVLAAIEGLRLEPTPRPARPDFDASPLPVAPVAGVRDGTLAGARATLGPPKSAQGTVRVVGPNELWLPVGCDGDFRMVARLSLESLDGTAAALEVGPGSWFGLDGAGGGGRRLFVEGPLFGAGVRDLGPSADWIEAGRPFDLIAQRAGPFLTFAIDGRIAAETVWCGPVDRFALRPRRGAFRVEHWELLAPRQHAIELPLPAAYSVPLVDLASETERQVVVDREPGQYLGHPTTALLEDGRTILCVYPKGHGRGPICMKRSTDGGLSWSERLPLPESWASSHEVPTLHRVTAPDGKRRLILWSGLYPARRAVSEDDGRTWSELEPAGDWGGIVVMASVFPVAGGDWLGVFHDDGRFLHGSGLRDGFHVYQTRSRDGGLSWSEPRAIASHPQADLCEPGAVRSPDGRRLALLLRENRRVFNSFVIFSDDEGRTWSEPRQLPAALTGDRHVARYAPDGRLLVTFRDTTRISPTQGDWVAWVGTWDDLARGREGQYRVRLMDNHHRWDCGYAGLELLPDGTFVATSYGHWSEGQEPWIASVRFRIEDLDAHLPR